VKSYQIVGPSWLDTEHYDIVALKPSVKPEQTPMLLQHLLAERFGIVVRRETRDVPVYALFVDKGGPNLKSLEEADPVSSNSVTLSSTGHISARTISGLVNVLSTFMDRPVIDMTGIQGAFRIELDISMQDLVKLQTMFANIQRPHSEMPGGDADDLRPSVFTAVKRLGLTLKSQRKSVELIILERGEMVPTEN
jgi:uncharacterized protein (TIGR03435 family)